MKEAQNMNCDDAARLLPRWGDGELERVRADELRRHLLDCRECRARYAQQRNLDRWIVAPKVPAVPVGFAERVARLAAASGVRPLSAPSPRAEVDTLVPARSALAGNGAAAGGAASSRAVGATPIDARGAGSALPFVLACTAAAAAILLGLALALARQDRPRADFLLAEPRDMWQRLLEENRREAEANSKAEATSDAARSTDLRGRRP